jgi:phage terminase large subunit-like protein
MIARRGSSAPLGKADLMLIPGYDPWKNSTGYDVDWGAANRACEFFGECITHVEGSVAGQPYILEPWERAIVGNIFGWKDAKGMRRYKEVFIFVPRKNSKTTLTAGITNCIFFTDHEPGAQIYMAAAEREQATLCFSIAAQMIRQEPYLAERCAIFPGSKKVVLNREFERGKPSEIKAISADANTKHGFNVHAVVIDELHAQPNRDLVDVLMTGTASRKQPIVIHITTSDFERQSVCNEKHDYASKVRDGIISDPSFFPAIWEASRDDDWKSPATWKKANPNYGKSVTEAYLSRECQRAIDSPSYENTFKRLHLNIRTEQDVRWLSMNKWDDSDSEQSELEGKECFAALDLASTSDLSALVLLFANGEHLEAKPFFWVPRETAKRRDRDSRVPYLQWINQGFIKTTEGDATDYDVIRRDINALRQKYIIKEIAFDPWNATQLANQLADDGFELIKFNQNISSLSEPTKRLERLILSSGISFGKNPVLRWMASNVTVHQDSSGNIRPDRKKSTEKIDGIVALVMALGRHLSKTDETSVYKSRGILTI